MDSAALSPLRPPPRVNPGAESAPNSATHVHQRPRQEPSPPVEEPATTHMPRGRHTIKRVLEQVRASWADITGEPKKIKSFDPHSAVTKMLGRLDKYHLKRDSEGPLEVVKLVAENRPAHEFTKFFMDPVEVAAAAQAGQPLNTVSLWSVPSKPMAEEGGNGSTWFHHAQAPPGA